ncbi:hypothetical protein [Salsuginibacillus kocurii]|nr:hypothetical protein [Salsuginibacillus kocurii]
MIHVMIGELTFSSAENRELKTPAWLVFQEIASVAVVPVVKASI